MKLAFELVPDLATHIAPHHRFCMFLSNDGEEISGTRGSDSYRYNAMVLPGQPIAATGRNAEHDHEPDLNGIKGVDGAAVEVPLTAGDLEGLTVCLDNNLILSQEILQSFYSLRCRAGDKVFLFPLRQPLCRVSWDCMGMFNISVGPLCSQLLKSALAESDLKG